MALKLQVSNSLSQLADGLFEEIRERNIGVFQSNYIVTQTEGMNNWLKLQMAAKLGIAANYRFLKPNDLIHEVYRLLGGQYLQPLSAESQSWLLFKLLADREFIQRFPAVSEYYSAEGPDQELKRMALAEKVADLFDQYQIYRPELIRQWNQGRLEDTGRDDWQKYLWIKAKQISGERLPDKTVIGNFILEALKQPGLQALLSRNMTLIHIFGLSVITEFHVQLFHTLGLYTDVNFQLLNPAPGIYWFEDRSEKHLAKLRSKGFADASETSMGNTLLTSWGNVVQNTFGLLFKNEELINAYEERDVAEPVADSLLHIIQEDIFYNRSDEERAVLTLEDLKDGSVSINSCYTAAREVEALYNYLVHLVDQKKEALSARDIVVMVSDIDAYAPYIRAVFNNAPYPFPFSIADESYTLNDTIAGAMQAIFSVSAGEFKAESVLQLLDSGYIRRRFGLNDTDLIRRVVDRANIRFGIDGDPEDESVYVSWKYGLKRIIYGICMSGGEEFIAEDDSFFPLDMLEGAASQELIRFVHFIEVLIDSIKERQRNRTVAEWGRYTEQVLNNLVFDPGDEADEDYAMMLNQLERYNVIGEVLTEQVSFDVFSRSFLQSAGGTLRTGSFAAGGITFCSLIPMRSIPFKVVALLGLNFDKFPRKDTVVNFNLMERDRRKGDRNVKENDKHLFLETLLSAQKYLYISYIGQSVKDNTAIPPSALVDELLDYIRSGCTDERSVNGTLVRRHALHRFGKKYTGSSGAVFNYLEDNETLLDTVPATKDPDVPELKNVAIESLIGFFKNPVKAYYNKVLSIYYRDEEVLLTDTELFELDGLQKWSLKQDLLYVEADELPVFTQKLVKTGGLPLKNMAGVVISQCEEEVAPVRQMFLNCTGGAEESSVEIDLEFPGMGMRLSGTMKKLYDDRLVLVCWSGNECKYQLEAYLRFLMVSAQGFACELYFISSKDGAAYQGIGMSAEDAKARLTELLKIYREGHEAVLPFWPDFPFKPVDITGLDHERFIKGLKRNLENYEYPCSDQYIMNKYHEGFFDEKRSFDRYVAVAEKLIMPLAELFPEYYQ